MERDNPPGPHAGLMPRLRALMFVAVATYSLAFVGRILWSIITPFASKDIGLNNAQSGSYSSAFILGYLLAQIPAGYLADRIGYRRILIFAFLVIGSLMLALSTIHAYDAGVAAMLLIGVACGSVFSSCVTAVTETFPDRKRGFGFSLLQLGASCGVVLANIALPRLMMHYGWRSALMAVGSVGIACFVAALCLLGLRSQARSALAPKVRARDVARGILANRNLLFVMGIGFLGMFVEIGFLNWAGTYMVRVLKFNAVQMGNLYVLAGLAPIIWVPIQGKLADRIRQSKRLLVSAVFLAMALVIAIFPLLSPGQGFAVVFTAIGALIIGFLPLLTMFIPRYVVHEEVGIATGIVNSCWLIGGMVSPVLMGKLLDLSGGNYAMVFWIFALVAALTSIVALFMDRVPGGAEVIVPTAMHRRA